MAIRRLGWFGSDALDFVVSAAGSAVSSAGSVLANVPGVDEFASVVSDTWTGPLRDFAHTAIGTGVLTALASASYGPLAYALGGPYGLANFGAQLATVIWALPGVARGEAFVSSWAAEVIRRSEETAAYFGGGAAGLVVTQLGISTDFVKDLAPEEMAALEAMPSEVLEGAVKELAKAAGVDDWSIAMVLSQFSDQLPAPPDWSGIFSFDEKGALPFRSAFTGTVALPSYAREAMQLIPIDRGILARPAYAALAAQLTGSRPLDPAAFGLTSPISVASPASDARKRQGDVILFVVVAAAAGALYYWRKELAR